MIGGRPVHPVNLKIGGFHRALRAEELAPVAETLRVAREELIEAVAWAGGLEFPEREIETEFAALGVEDALSDRARRAALERRRADRPRAASRTTTWRPRSPHSTALHSHHRERGSYMVGPLARYGAVLRPAAGPDRATPPPPPGSGPVCRNPFQSIVVRCVEMLYAADEALRLIDDYEQPPPTPDADAPPPQPAAAGARRRGGCSGTATSSTPTAGSRTARIVAPTSQNQAAIEEDLRGLVAGQPRPGRRRAAVALRAGGPQLRSLHLLLDPLPGAGIDRG